MNLSNVWLKLRTKLEQLPFGQQLVFAGILVGIASGASAYVFTKLINFFNASGFGIVREWPPLLKVPALVVLPALGGLVAGWITSHYCPEARGSGLPEVVKSIKEGEGKIRGRVAWYKTLASAATIGLGGSAGKEGPVIQIGAAIGSSVGRFLEISESNLKTLAAAGAVGGLAACFSIPLAGVFFTMEVILQDFAHEAFSAVVVSAVIASVTARLLLGNQGFFTPLNYEWNHASDFLLYVFLGVLCAPIGILYRRTLKAFDAIFTKEQRIPDWLKPAAGGLLVGLLGLGLPQILGEGHELTNQVLQGQNIGWLMLVLVFGKILATSLTLGSGGSGGSLMPSLFIGAMAGGAFAKVVGVFSLALAQPGTFAIVGMACVFTSSFLAPVTAIVMAFELTRDYGILLPVMLACVMTFLFSRDQTANH